MSSGTASTRKRTIPGGCAQWISLGPDGRVDPISEPSLGTSSTRVSTQRSRLASAFLPIAIAAAFVGASPLRELRRFGWTGAETPVQDIWWDYADEPWLPVPELVTNEQVRALNALLAVPYTNDHGFEYFADD